MAEVAVIGAGMAGAACARALSDTGVTPTIFEMGTRPGGRMASLAKDEAIFDSGAQYFTARDPAFQRQVERWMADGCAAPWICRTSDPVPRPRFVGVPDMAAPVLSLLHGIPVSLATRVCELKRGGHLWQLCSDGHSLGRFDTVVLALPASDAGLLLDGELLQDALRPVRLEPCWSAMVAFDQRVASDLDVIDVGHGSIALAVRNGSKPGRGEVEAWTVHARPAFSIRHRAAAPELVVEKLLAEFAELVGRPLPAVRHREARFWPASLVSRAAGEPCLSHREAGLFAAGDWCLGPRVEAAWLSGRAAAAAVLLDL